MLEVKKVRLSMKHILRGGSRKEALPLPKGNRSYTVVGSRSHMSPETEAFFEEKKKEYGEVEVMAVGSSLKLCMVAEGKQMLILGMLLLWNGIQEQDMLSYWLLDLMLQNTIQQNL